MKIKVKLKREKLLVSGWYELKSKFWQVLLAQMTGQPEYQNAARAFCDFSVRQQKRTPKGLLYIDKFGTLCHAANVAFVCLEAADSPGIGDPQEYREFAEQQIYYMLGGGGKLAIIRYGSIGNCIGWFKGTGPE